MKEMKRMGGGIRGTVLGLERRGFCMFMGGIQKCYVGKGRNQIGHCGEVLLLFETEPYC